MQAGREGEALEAFEAALRLDPGFAKAHFNRGVILGRLGRLAEAAEAFRAVIRETPDDGQAWYNLGNCHDGLGEAVPALEAWERALALEPGLAAAHFNRGMLLLERGDAQGAERHRQALADVDPEAAATLARAIAAAGGNRP